MSLVTKEQAKAVAPAARERARQAAQQLGPIAKTARENAAQQLHGARVWAAPRIEHAAHSVQDNVAPKVSAVLQATAHRLEPAPGEPTPGELKKLGRRARRRANATSHELSARRAKALAKANKQGRRWPKVMGSVVLVAATIGAITAVTVRRNRDKMAADLDDAALAAAEMEEAQAAADAEAGFDGRARTPNRSMR